MTMTMTIAMAMATRNDGIEHCFGHVIPPSHAFFPLYLPAFPFFFLAVAFYSSCASNQAVPSPLADLRARPDIPQFPLPIEAIPQLGGRCLNSFHFPTLSDPSSECTYAAIPHMCSFWNLAALVRRRNAGKIDSLSMDQGRISGQRHSRPPASG